MGPNTLTENSVDPDQTPPRGLKREKKLCQFIKNILKPLLFSEILFYSLKI